MNILFLTRLYKPHVGGVERHVENLKEELHKTGHNVQVVTTSFKSGLKKSEGDILRIKVPDTRLLSIFYIWYWFLKRVQLIKEADVIHAHDVGIWYWPFRLIFPRKTFFITFHGYQKYPPSFKERLYRKIDEIASHGNICIGDFISKWFGVKETKVSYGAVNLDEFKPDTKKDYKYDAYFASRLDDQTGILTYIDALKKLKSFKLLVLGDGKYKKKAEKVAEVKGFVDKPQDFIGDARFAFVSRYLAILEAFASKKLVFAVYDNPIKKDYLKMAPFSEWIIIEKDPDKLADKVRYYKDNEKKAKEMTEKAYTWVKNQTWKKMSDLYLDLWKEKR